MKFIYHRNRKSVRLWLSQKVDMVNEILQKYVSTKNKIWPLPPFKLPTYFKAAARYNKIHFISPLLKFHNPNEKKKMHNDIFSLHIPGLHWQYDDNYGENSLQKLCTFCFRKLCNVFNKRMQQARYCFRAQNHTFSACILYSFEILRRCRL